MYAFPNLEPSLKIVAPPDTGTKVHVLWVPHDPGMPQHSSMVFVGG